MRSASLSLCLCALLLVAAGCHRRQQQENRQGLAAQPTPEEVYASPNLVRQALAADLAYPPGSHFFYDNKAVNLLAGIVEKASGRKLDEYVRDELFAPLGIARFAWMRDPSGNPHVLAGLQLDARDLARVGQLMLDQGLYDGKRLLAAAFVRRGTPPGGQESRGLYCPISAPPPATAPAPARSTATTYRRSAS